MTPAIAVDVLRQALQPKHLNGALDLSDLALCFQALQVLMQAHPMPKPEEQPAASPVKEVVPAMAEVARANGRVRK